MIHKRHIAAFAIPLLILAGVLWMPMETHAAIEPFNSLTGIGNTDSSTDFGVIGKLFSSNDGTSGGGLSGFVNTAFRTALSIGALLAVLMIAWSGWEWMVSDIADKRKQAQARFQNAIIGLLMLLATVLILRQINPDIVALRLFQNIPQASNSSPVNTTTTSTGTTRTVSAGITTNPYGYCAQVTSSGYQCYNTLTECISAHGVNTCDGYGSGGSFTGPSREGYLWQYLGNNVITGEIRHCPDALGADWADANRTNCGVAIDALGTAGWGCCGFTGESTDANPLQERLYTRAATLTEDLQNVPDGSFCYRSSTVIYCSSSENTCKERLSTIQLSKPNVVFDQCAQYTQAYDTSVTTY